MLILFSSKHMLTFSQPVDIVDVSLETSRSFFRHLLTIHLAGCDSSGNDLVRYSSRLITMHTFADLDSQA